MREATYTDEQIRQAVKYKLVSFSEFMEYVGRNNADYRLVLHIDRLLLNIYLLHLDGKYMSKTQACKLIPADHMETCQKYVAEAQRLNFVKFSHDEHDKRRINVIPTAEFIGYVRKKAAVSLDEARRILSGTDTTGLKIVDRET